MFLQPATTAWADTSSSASQLLSLHNAERKKARRPALKLNAKLSAAAQKYAEYLYRAGKFSHTADGRTPWQRITATGYRYKAAGENLAKGYPNAKAVTNAWMHSSGHRANILNSSYTEVGFGVYRGVWVADFARPR